MRGHRPVAGPIDELLASAPTRRPLQHDESGLRNRLPQPLLR